MTAHDAIQVFARAQEVLELMEHDERRNIIALVQRLRQIQQPLKHLFSSRRVGRRGTGSKWSHSRPRCGR